MDIPTILQKGDASGNGMVANFCLPSGLEIITLSTKNFYGGHWDLGPTWNYAVMADQPFLVDAGRFGQGRHLFTKKTASAITGYCRILKWKGLVTGRKKSLMASPLCTCRGTAPTPWLSC